MTLDQVRHARPTSDYDGLYGLKDGLIFNINACPFDPKTLVCKGANADGCLSMAQATTLEKAFGGPKDSKGRQVYPGFLFDTGIAVRRGFRVCCTADSFPAVAA